MNVDTEVGMKAGRELDALVYKAVFSPDFWYKGDVPPTAPCYSTDIAAAWEVVEKLVGCGASFGVFRSLDVDGAEGTEVYIETSPEEFATAWGETTPLAICKAALDAVGHPIDP